MLIRGTNLFPTFGAHDIGQFNPEQLCHVCNELGCQGCKVGSRSATPSLGEGCNLGARPATPFMAVKV